MRTTSFVKSAAKLAGSSAAAQVLAFVWSVAYARIYSPEDIGLYALVLTGESLLGGILSLRCEALIVSEPEEGQALGYCRLALLLSAVVSVLGAAVYRAICLTQGSQGNLVWPLLITLLARGAWNILSSWNNRHSDYGRIAASCMVRTLTQGLCGVSLGLAGTGVVGLAAAHAVGMMMGTVCQAGPLWRQRRALLQRGKYASWNPKKAYRQIVFSTPAVFANRFSHSAISVLTEKLFGSAALGFYSTASKVVSLPVEVLSQSLASVFFREASVEHTQTGRFTKTLRKTSLLMLGLSLLVGVVGYVAAPWAFTLVYGAEWAFCGQVARWILPMMCVRMVVSAVAQGFQIAGRQEIELALQSASAVGVLVCGLLSGCFGWPMETFLRVASAVLILVYAATYLWIFHLAQGKKSSVQRLLKLPHLAKRRFWGRFCTGRCEDTSAAKALQPLRQPPGTRTAQKPPSRSQTSGPPPRHAPSKR